MKTLVTGSTGFIGSHLVKALLQKGRDVIAACESAGPGAQNLDNLGIKQNEIELRSINLTNYQDALNAIAGADVVFHLAACVGSLEFLHGNENAELYALQSNMLIDTNVFKACLERGVKKLIYASSCAVYPMNRQFVTGTRFSESIIDLHGMDFLRPQKANWKQLEIDPDGGYGWSKLIGELQLAWMANVNIGIARIFNIYGINEPLGDKAHVVGDLIRKTIQYEGGQFKVRGNGKQSRDFLYVSDCVAALLKLEQKASSPPTIFNIGSGQAADIEYLINIIIKISGKDINITFDTTEPMGPISRTADISRIYSSTGWEPKINLDEGLTFLYKWAEQRLRM